MDKKETRPLNVFTVKWIMGSEALNEPHYVRREVFMKEQNVSEEEEMDDADYFSQHVVVSDVDASKPVGTGRIFEEAGTFFIGRVAVLKEYRGKKVGKLIMEKLLEKAIIPGGPLEVHLHAQTCAVGFYEKLGFFSYGEIFLEADIEHVCMMKKL